MSQLIHVGTNPLKNKIYSKLVEEVRTGFNKVYGDEFTDYFQHLPLEDINPKLQKKVKNALKRIVEEYAYNLLTFDGEPIIRLSGLGNVKFIRQSKYNKDFKYPKFEYEAKNLNNLSSAITIIWHLNDVEEKGELEFSYDEIMIQPSNKEVVVFPSYFTHAHKFHPGNTEKYFLITTFYIG